MSTDQQGISISPAPLDKEALLALARAIAGYLSSYGKETEGEENIITVTPELLNGIAGTLGPKSMAGEVRGVDTAVAVIVTMQATVALIHALIPEFPEILATAREGQRGGTPRSESCQPVHGHSNL